MHATKAVTVWPSNTDALEGTVTAGLHALTELFRSLLVNVEQPQWQRLHSIVLVTHVAAVPGACQAE